MKSFLLSPRQIFGLITAVVSYLASVSTLPSQKDWLWKPIAGLTKDQKQKKEEQGGVSIKSSLMKLDFKELDEQVCLLRAPNAPSAVSSPRSLLESLASLACSARSVARHPKPPGTTPHRNLLPRFG